MSAMTPAAIGTANRHGEAAVPSNSRILASYGGAGVSGGDGGTFGDVGAAGDGAFAAVVAVAVFAEGTAATTGGDAVRVARGFAVPLDAAAGAGADGGAAATGAVGAGADPLTAPVAVPELVPDPAVPPDTGTVGGGGGRSRTMMGMIISLFVESSSPVSGAETIRTKIWRSPTTAGCQSTHTSSSIPFAFTENGGGVPIAVPFSEKKTFPCTSRSPMFRTVAYTRTRSPAKNDEGWIVTSAARIITSYVNA